MRYLIAIIVLLVCAAGCTAPGPAPSPISVTVHDIKPFSIGNKYLMPPSGYKTVVVDFSIKNNGPGSFHFNPLNAAIRDPNQVSYKYTVASSTSPGYFGLIDIPAGETRRGNLVFAVPANQPKGTNYIISISGPQK